MDTDEISKLLKQYEIMIKMFTAHMKHCKTFEKEVLDVFKDPEN